MKLWVVILPLDRFAPTGRTQHLVILFVQCYREPSLCGGTSENFSELRRSILALPSLNVGDLLWRQRGPFSNTESLSDVSCLNVTPVLNKTGIGGAWGEDLHVVTAYSVPGARLGVCIYLSY